MAHESFAILDDLHPKTEPSFDETSTIFDDPQMKKNSIQKQDDYELREEYDLARMTILPRGRFAPRDRIGSNIVVLEPDVAKAFPSDEAANEALRLLLKASKLTQGDPAYSIRE
jgi:hypothetical protein